MSLEANKRLVLRLIDEVFNRGLFDAADELVTVDYIQHNPAAPPGRAGLKLFAQGLLAAFPDNHLEVVDLIAEGDRVVCRILGRGTHRGEFLGVPPTGRVIHGTSIDIFRVEGGLLAEHWDVLDVHGMLLQMRA